MPKIFNAWKQLNFKPPVIDNSIANYRFKMTFPLVEKTKRVKTETGCEKIGEKVTENQQKIINLIAANLKTTAAELAEKVGISRRKIEVNIFKLKEMKIIERIGADRGGSWRILI